MTSRRTIIFAPILLVLPAVAAASTYDPFQAAFDKAIEKHGVQAVGAAIKSNFQKFIDARGIDEATALADKKIVAELQLFQYPLLNELSQ